MEWDGRLCTGVEPLLRSGLKGQWSVVALVVDVGRKRPARAVAGTHFSVAPTLLCGGNANWPDVPTLALDRRPSLVLALDVPARICPALQMVATNGAGGAG
jgi:hypothetical protein